MAFEKLLVSNRDCIHVLDFSCILFFRSNDCYTRVFLADGREFLLIKSLSKVEKEISSNKFIRISQSFLVNRNFITTIHKKKKAIFIENTHSLPFTISLRKLSELMVS